jgi:ergothioneine biosynthesis protein EgtB
LTALDYCTVRDVTERLAAPLSAEDQTVQSMPDTSPTKWHRAHTTWFFETFVLGPHVPTYVPYDEHFAYLFNSYYEAAGPRHARPERGLITRPGVEEVAAYRRHVDGAMQRLLQRDVDPELAALVQLGLHHEQQHQELLVMDITHVLSCNPTTPVYGRLPWSTDHNDAAQARASQSWVEHPGGVVSVGHDGTGFAFDNEGPRHDTALRPFSLAAHPVTNAEWLAFMDDGGYRRPELWMSDGWHTVQSEAWTAPGYWQQAGGNWRQFGLLGLRDVDPHAPVTHVSWFEADAYARWAGARLPLESEWEVVAPRPHEDGSRGWYSGVWQWTASPYVAYPGFRPAAGAIGEYNGKFMVSQMVLRGGCFATPPGHARRTYRNFFPPHVRWPFTGLRLARDLD